MHIPKNHQRVAGGVPMGNYIDLEDSLIEDISLLESNTDTVDNENLSEPDRNLLQIQRRRDLEERLDLRRMLDDI
jgi:hypothetical protein